MRLLSLLDLQALLGDADNAEWGVLNLLGLSNPLGSVAPNYIVWGNVADWSDELLPRLGQARAEPRGRVHRLGHERRLRASTWSGAPASRRAATSDARRVHVVIRALASRRRHRSSAAVGLAGARSSASACCGSRSIDIPVEWVAFSLLTFAAGLLMLKVPSVDAVVLDLGGVCLLVPAALRAGDGRGHRGRRRRCCCRARRRHVAAQTIFNVGNLTFCVWVSGTLFFAVAGVAPLFHSPSLPRVLLLPLGVMAACYFLINSGLLGVGRRLRNRVDRRSTVWREHFLGLAPTYAAGASLALLLVVVLSARLHAPSR